MILKAAVLDFINSPFPLWEHKLTRELVRSKLDELSKSGLPSPTAYSTHGVLTQQFSLDYPKRMLICGSDVSDAVVLEHASQELDEFYDAQGLVSCSETELASNSALLKLQSAFKVLQEVEPVALCVQELVKSIQVLRQEDPEIDVSYSHPAIPFSIFVSVCEDTSPVSNLRVAESILHEAMHLKLTLIEQVVPLVKQGTTDLFYSPWRDEERPLRGVLHGLFVFCCLQTFFHVLNRDFKAQTKLQKFLVSRIQSISEEINLIVRFPESTGLTNAGKKLAIRLIQPYSF